MARRVGNRDIHDQEILSHLWDVYSCSHYATSGFNAKRFSEVEKDFGYALYVCTYKWNIIIMEYTIIKYIV